ncbi:hypothetical protein [Arthrobacter sp. FW306-06-A]|uniref:hypothetical protein n=1 Tax=Arthrobacter sp. FW306-06-A TaxID=2879621 RepID=UPI001F1BFE4F|nr:hypothetical protein [Arthrobacter sp. FW306-06-A]UKA69540.1 hypothetical protein LFT49_12230 [Arthrobacter sp. FW306-06-A]
MTFPEMGLSAQAIAGGGRDHPHDPSDLRRCMNYCNFRGISTEQLRERMTGRSTQWDRLLPEWDNLTALLRHEMDTRTDGNAPATYQEMKRVLAAGIACTDCGGTGRGIECPKCKGTGRRSRGRCRAANCYRGADFCPSCSGRGHHVIRQAVTV